VISLACCTFTLLSFLIDVSRFAYPERPIIYLGACFAMIAVALVVGFAVGDDIACDDEAGREVQRNFVLAFFNENFSLIAIIAIMDPIQIRIWIQTKVFL
jgi:hypothetical protein